jgi:hypothetical protein
MTQNYEWLLFVAGWIGEYPAELMTSAAEKTDFAFHLMVGNEGRLII